MNINHCIVNWAYEDEILLEPYEWEEDDPIEWLFQVEVVCVYPQLLQDCLDATLDFHHLSPGYYILCDKKRTLAIALDEHRHLCMRSLLDYRLQTYILKLTQTCGRNNYTYTIYDYQQPKEYGLTRYEKEKKQLLMACLDLFDQEELSLLSDDNWHYIEQGYHLFHEYFYTQMKHLNNKKV